jgi:FkbM family methyltransferase
MNRSDRIKLDFIRNWHLPGKERLSRWFKPSDQLRATLGGGIVWLNGEDIAIHTTADNYIEWAIISNGTYESEINKLIRISLKNGGSALDIGANIGLQSIRMSQCAGETGKVFAFEPLIYLQEKFRRNMILNGAFNVKLFPFALADEEKDAEFTIDKKSWNHGTFSLNDKNGGAERQQVVIKVADMIPEIGDMNALDLVKIDVEGFEFHVLKGLKKTLEKHKPRIIFEYDKNYWINAGQDITDCFTFLQLLGYTLYQVTPVGCELITSAADIDSGNLFCIYEKG